MHIKPTFIVSAFIVVLKRGELIITKAKLGFTLSLILFFVSHFAAIHLWFFGSQTVESTN